VGLVRRGSSHPFIPRHLLFIAGNRQRVAGSLFRGGSELNWRERFGPPHHSMDITLNIISPLDKLRPFAKQMEFLSLDCSGTDKTYNHYVGGRGSSKTTTGVLKCWTALTQWHRGKSGIWTEPTSTLCKDVFLREWRKIVPSDCYKATLNPLTITMCRELGGGTLDVRSHNADNPNKEIAKGPNYAFGFIDEAAYKFRPDWFDDIDNAIRDGSRYLFLDTMSTPKLNGYKKLCFSEGHRLVKASSFDNPHLPPGWAEKKRSQMGEKRFAQEIMGEWVALTGQIWDNFSEDEWPAGNIIDYEHDHSKPYYLFFDLGVASSAWLIVQPLGFHELGYDPFPHNDPVWCVTAQYMPTRDGNASRMLQQIKNEFGTPVRVCCGHDLGRRSDADSATSEYFLANIMGSVPTITIGAETFLRDKVVQQDTLSYLIHNTKNERRLAISKNLISHDPDERGILQMMREDEWDDGTSRTANYLPKEGRLEHVRDAILYGAVGAMKPPSYTLKTAYAA